jgi:hypothetical protein
MTTITNVREAKQTLINMEALLPMARKPEQACRLVEELRVSINVAEQEAADVLLLKRAAKDAAAWAATIDESYLGSRPRQQVGKNRDLLIGAIEKLVSVERSLLVITDEEGKELGKRGRVEKELVETRKAARAALDKLNSGREYMGLSRLSPEEVRTLVELEYERQEKEEGQRDDDSVISYVADQGVGVEHGLNADSLREDIGDEISRSEAIAEYSLYSVDPKWSEKATKRILDCMDPNGLGRATRPMSFNGKSLVWKNGIAFWMPLTHYSVKQSLVWLQGHKGNGRLGMLRDPRFTQEHRQVLMEFVSNSWEHFNS